MLCWTRARSRLYARFQPSCFKTEVGDKGDRRWEGRTDSIHKKFDAVAVELFEI